MTDKEYQKFIEQKKKNVKKIMERAKEASERFDKTYEEIRRAL
tara:strand:- start:4461 stop:4589 length:129 start_codon:yes stop_codon:yes gene_type:complete